MRGEYPAGYVIWISRIGTPPHARGIQLEKCRNLEDQLVHPHMRGEYVLTFSSVISRTGTPPLAWEILMHHTKIKPKFRNTPTCVGNTEVLWFQLHQCLEQPHVRGEYAREKMREHIACGSPPRARGILLQDAELLSSQWVHPPHARGIHLMTCRNTS